MYRFRAPFLQVTPVVKHLGKRINIIQMKLLLFFFCRDSVFLVSFPLIEI
jgi:hypothetical protein